MKQAQLDNFFNALTEVQESSNNDQKQVILQKPDQHLSCRSSLVPDTMCQPRLNQLLRGCSKIIHITHPEGGSCGREKGTFYLTYSSKINLKWRENGGHEAPNYNDMIFEHSLSKTTMFMRTIRVPESIQQHMNHCKHKVLLIAFTLIHPYATIQ